MATTVYPARAGAFPAVSFRNLTDANQYAFELQLGGPAASGVCMCPAESFLSKHYPDTIETAKLYERLNLPKRCSINGKK